MQRSNSNRDISNNAPAHMSHGGNTNFVYDLLRKIVQPTCQTHPRLCHEINRPQFERLHSDLGSTLGESRNHDNWHRAQTHQTAQKINAIHPRHLNIQRDDVWIELPNHFSGNQGIIRCPYALHVPLAIDDFGEQTTCRIPDDCIDSKRYPLFIARAVLKELIESLQSTQGVKPC